MERYNMQPLEEYFNNIETPKQLMRELASMMFNYASVVDEDSLPTFKRDVETICCLYQCLDRMEKAE